MGLEQALRRHALSAAGVLILHVAVVVMLVMAIETGESQSYRELQVTVFSPHPTTWYYIEHGELPPLNQLAR